MLSFIALRAVVIVLVTIATLGLIANPLLAAPDMGDAIVCPAASFFQEIAGNRSKIIQLSIVFVIVGIALLFKK